MTVDQKHFSNRMAFLVVVGNVYIGFNSYCVVGGRFIYYHAHS